MKGVAREMSLTLATLTVLACQGCENVPVLSQHAPVQRYETKQAMVPTLSPQPLLGATPSFTIKQGQTNISQSISIVPILGQSTVSPVQFNFESTERLGDLRASNSAGVINFEARRNIANILNPVRSMREFDAEVALSAGDDATGLGFDVGVVPRMSMSQDGEFEQRSFGGEIRIGQNFDQRGEASEDGSWYLFAAADGEALVYQPDDDRNFSNRMALRDQVTVGDLQAGVSLSRGGGQLSLSYIRREVSYRDRVAKGSEDEDFAGLSFTIRR